MEMQNFEDKLIQMTKPVVPKLKHEDMLAKAITNAKDKSVVSWWWLAIPIYLAAMLTMKTIYMPVTTIHSNIRELSRYTSVLFFVVLPVTFMVVNFASLWKIYFLSGSPTIINLLKTAWHNVLVIILSVLVLIIYSL